MNIDEAPPATRRVCASVRRTLQQYDAPSLAGVRKDAVWRSYCATSQKGRFVRERVAPLASGAHELAASIEPLAELTQRAGVLDDDDDLTKVADLFAALISAAAALATALRGAKRDRTAAAARFQSTAAAVRQRACALAKRTLNTPARKHAEVHNGAIFVSLTSARGATRAASPTSALLRNICKVMMVIVLFVVVQVLFVTPADTLDTAITSFETWWTGTTTDPHLFSWGRYGLEWVGFLEPVPEELSWASRAAALARKGVGHRRSLDSFLATLWGSISRSIGMPATFILATVSTYYDFASLITNVHLWRENNEIRHRLAALEHDRGKKTQ